MKLLLCKNVDHLGIVGDVVEVAPGYARNYLVPHGLATEPTDANMRRLAEARKQAEEERSKRLAVLEDLAKNIEGTELTIRAKANEDGVLYGSVSTKEILAALHEEGYTTLEASQINLGDPIRHLDNVTVDLKLSQDIRTSIKVWVVREKVEGEEEAGEGEEAAAETPEGSTEGIADGDSAEDSARA